MFAEDAPHVILLQYGQNDFAIGAEFDESSGLKRGLQSMGVIVTSEAVDSPFVADPAETPSRMKRVGRNALTTLLAPAAALLALLLHLGLPNHQSPLPTHAYPVFLAWVLGITLLAAACMLGFPFLYPAAQRRLAAMRSMGPLVAVGILLLAVWDLVTLKFALLPLPHFPGPDMVFQSFLEDWSELANCAWHSLILLMSGYVSGVASGLICGVLIGWSPRVRYWGMPALKIIGPMPATAWIPLAMVICPGSFFAAMAIIALAVWFPVTMLTISGVSNVRMSYLDVARTLGAGRSYLIFRVAIPAALPSIFIGLFMGLGASFLTLVVAEGIGVSSGLAWYADEARSGMEYSKIYASLIITAIFFSVIMTLLFKVRDRVLVWQKGVIKW
jgi:NitT/TauT family transport system permease protein